MSDFKQWLNTPEGVFTQGVIYGAALIFGLYAGYKAGDHIYDFGYRRGLRDGSSLEKRNIDVNSIDFKPKKRRFCSMNPNSEDIVKEIIKTNDNNLYGAKKADIRTINDDKGDDSGSTVQDDGGNK